ncbi:MAG: acyltransferase [Vicinamibacteria bacterium]|nr:acyltransferase [Vicinamibacteria bacterium]
MQFEVPKVEGKAPGYLPGLDGLRFLAAAAVVIHHVEWQRTVFGLDSPFWTSGMQRLGALGVTFFFVLSGYLITYLLLSERDRTGSIDVAAFYWRRVLRIWPLYLLIAVLGLVLLPQVSAFDSPAFAAAGDQWQGRRMLFTFSFSAHFLRVYELELGAGLAGVLWSVGVEEHFYAVWPWLVRGARRRLTFLLVCIVVGFPLMRLAVGALLGAGPDVVLPHWRLRMVDTFLDVARFDCMSIGALGAVLHQRRREWLSWIFARPAQLSALALLAVGILAGLEVPVIDEGLYSALFLVVILNAAANPAALVRPTGAGLDYLGQISYGIYCYHLIVIVWCLNVMPHDGLTTPLGMLSLYAASFLGTIAVSALSYWAFEAPFLRLKRRFAR